MLLVDADPQQSALLWAQQDPIFPFTVVSMPVRTLHRDLTWQARSEGIELQEAMFAPTPQPPAESFAQ